MSTATISKDFEFSAGHFLAGLSPKHPCSREHGHNYVVRVTVTGKLDDVGFVVDYRDFGWFKTYLDEYVDHRVLNEVFGFNPTAENLAHYFLDKITDHIQAAPAGLRDRLTDVAVSVSETPKTWATVTTRKPWDLPITEEDMDRERYRWGHPPVSNP